MAKKRGLLELIFGGKKEQPTTAKRFELVNTPTGTYYSWDGNLYNSDIVRSMIRPKVNAVGKLNAKHMSGFGADFKVNTNSRAKALLARPNEYMDMQDFLGKMIWQREITNNAFAYVKREPMGGIVGIYPFITNSVELYELGSDIYVKFKFANGKTVTVPYSDVIHLRKDFIDNDFYGAEGVSPLKTNMEVINTTDQAVVNAMKTSAVIKWLMKFTANVRPDDAEKFREDFVKSNLKNSNETGVMSTDPRFDVEPVKQEQYTPNAYQMKSSIDRLYSYFGVNEAIVQNKYNEDQWNAFYEQEIEPIAKQLSNAFTRAFFSAREIGFGNKIVFAADSLQYASMKTVLGLQAMVDRGALTPNEWRRALNYPPLKGGDEPVRRLDTAEVGKGEDDGQDDSED